MEMKENFYLETHMRCARRMYLSLLLPPSSFRISLKDTSFYISINSLGFYYLLPEWFLNFLSDFYIPPCRKIFKFMESTFLENALIGGIFTHAPPHLKLAPQLLSSGPKQKEITHPPGSIPWKICFSNNRTGLRKL